MSDDRIDNLLREIWANNSSFVKHNIQRDVWYRILNQHQRKTRYFDDYVCYLIKELSDERS